MNFPDIEGEVVAGYHLSLSRYLHAEVIKVAFGAKRVDFVHPFRYFRISMHGGYRKSLPTSLFLHNLYFALNQNHRNRGDWGTLDPAFDQSLLRAAYTLSNFEPFTSMLTDTFLERLASDCGLLTFSAHEVAFHLSDFCSKLGEGHPFLHGGLDQGLWYPASGSDLVGKEFKKT